MAYTVFFKEGKELFSASNFIGQQPQALRMRLQTMADTLAMHGQITDPLAMKTSKGEWSILLKDDNGDAYIYTLLISSFEQTQTHTVSKKIDNTLKQRELVVIDPAGPKDSVGGFHPGYWTIGHYSTFLDEEQRKLFLTAISQIQSNTPSPYYTANIDGSISIDIRRQERTYMASIACRLEWR